MIIRQFICIKKRSERGLVSTEDCIDTLTQVWEDSIKKSKERLIAAKSNSNSNLKTNRKTAKRKARKQKWEENSLVQDTDWLGKVIHWEWCSRLKFVQMI